MTALMNMGRGDEAFTTMRHVHPATATISFDAPLQPEADDLACVMITRDSHGSFHVWGPLTDLYPLPELTGLSANFHLTRFAEVHDLGDVLELGGWS